MRPNRNRKINSGIRSAGALLALGGLACGGEGPPARSVADGPAAGEIRWTVDPVPQLSLGGEGGEPLFQVTDAVLLGTGTVAVADGAPRVLFFGPDGPLVRTVGGEGDGPGEFRRIEWIEPLASDSLAVWDASLRRVTYLSEDGSLGRVLSGGAEAGPDRWPPLAGMFADGSFLATRMLPPTDLPRTENLLIRPQLALSILGPDGGLVRELDTVPGPELGYVGGVRMPMDFARETFLAVGPDGYWVAPSEEFGAAAFDRTGGLLRTLERSHEPVPITEADLARPEWPAPSTFPAISAILLDSTGHLWIRPFTREEGAPVEWSVFGPGGSFRGTVTLPGRFEPTSIGGDYVLGVFRDDLDVEHVRLHALEKTTSGG